MNPMLRLAATAALAVLALGGALYMVGGGPNGPGPVPTLVPSPSPTAVAIAPSSTPWTGACTLVTGDEAEATAGVVGLGAIPYEVAVGDGTACLYSDGGGTPVLRLTWTPTGGAALFNAAQAKPGVEEVADLGDAAVYDPSTITLHVRQADAHLAIVVGELSPTDRLARSKAIAELALPRM